MTSLRCRLEPRRSCHIVVTLSTFWLLSSSRFYCGSRIAKYSTSKKHRYFGSRKSHGISLFPARCPDTVFCCGETGKIVLDSLRGVRDLQSDKGIFQCNGKTIVPSLPKVATATSKSRGAAVSKWLSWLKNIFLGLIVAVMVLLIMEAVPRVAKTVHYDLHREKVIAEEQWFVFSPTLGWERRPGYSGLAGYYHRDFDREGYFVVDAKQVADMAKKRVIFIGDSHTFGYGVPTESSFVEVVEKLLTDVNAINLGVIGYTSYQGRVCLDKYLLLLKPDLVVASFNYNDRRYVLPPDMIDSAAKFETKIGRASCRERV